MTEPNPKSTVDQEQQQLVTLLRSPVPKLYANGYGIIGSASDLSIALLFNNMPVGIASMSYITAKSLIGELTKAVTDFEKAIGQEVKTIDEITAGMTKVRGAGHVV